MDAPFPGIGPGVAAHYPLSPEAVRRFDAFHALLMEWNEKMDLTAVTEPREALVAHYLDALAGAALIPEGVRVIDVGTGAGFPGIPLFLLREDIGMTLLDARRKRVDFLCAALSALYPEGAKIHAVHGRAEDYAREHRAAFDVAVSRAVASLPVLLEWCLPLLCVGGRCVLYKGPGAEAEWAEAERVAPLLGGGAPWRVEADIPGGGLRHVLVVVEKTEETDARFPRKAGMALKRPL